ncbi:MAG: DegQ family serine endoprotease [Desulfobacterales bacterium]|nr:MAG: DegQ family serine endoprotease [Desulfobacterales bacterium]
MTVFLLPVLVCPIGAAESKGTWSSTAVPGSFSQLVKKASPSVVNISAVKIVQRSEKGPLPYDQVDPLNEFFNRFFRDQVPREFRQNSLGTGFIIDQEGFIITNSHVVEQSDEIKVKLADKREFSAEIVGRDPLTDVALIRIVTDVPLKPLILGNSDQVEVGDWVVAIGNPFGLGHTVTAGIVSAMYRQIGSGPYENFIQTDAPINPGNSGGPLLNTAGEVVGITTLIFSQSGGNLGIGFAIPINMAKDLLPQLKTGKVVRGWMGIMIQKITPDLKNKFLLNDEKGALVSDVITGSPADKAGIRRGDVIVAYDLKAVNEVNELSQMVASSPVGKSVVVEIMRSGRKQSFNVSIEELAETGEPPVAEEDRMDLGLVLQQVTPELARKFGLPRTSGLLVIEVEIDSAADQAGLAPGDIILEVDRVPVKDFAGFAEKIDGISRGETALLLIDRLGSTLFLTINIRG